MNDQPLFARRTAQTLAALMAAGLLIILFFQVFGGAGPTPSSAANDSYSRSAIGYRALVHWLETEVPVVVSRGYSVDKANRANPLLLLEPATDGGLESAFENTLAAAMARKLPVVLVLPKWYGLADPERPDWVSGVEPMNIREPNSLAALVLNADEDAGAVIRPGAIGPWHSELDGGGTPVLGRPQLLRPAERLEPILATDEGSLIARLADTSVYFIADPDLLNNHGLANPQNAEIARRLLLDHLDARGWIVDEGLHGYQASSSVWQSLLRYPLSLFSLHLALLAALVLWAGSLRFGPAAPAPSRLPPGKWTLVDNTARLLALGRRPGRSLGRYLRLTVERAAADVHLPPSLGYEQQLAELDRIAAARGARHTLRDIEREAAAAGERPDPRRMLVLARALFRWRQRLRRPSPSLRRPS